MILFFTKKGKKKMRRSCFVRKFLWHLLNGNWRPASFRIYLISLFCEQSLWLTQTLWTKFWPEREEEEEEGDEREKNFLKTKSLFRNETAFKSRSRPSLKSLNSISLTLSRSLLFEPQILTSQFHFTLVSKNAKSRKGIILKGLHSTKCRQLYAYREPWYYLSIKTDKLERHLLNIQM